MYKVLREVAEANIQGQKGETSLKVGGRVRSAEMKGMVVACLIIEL